MIQTNILNYKILQGNCVKLLSENKLEETIDLTFLDPPFNQNKDYNFHDDNLPDEEYWEMMETVCKSINKITSDGGSIYFMQREKNTENVLSCIRNSGWTFQNMVIWKKKSSAVPCVNKFGKHYQIIVFATKGLSPRIFNRLRIDPPLPPNYKITRENGMFLTDIWDDIRELTSGYFAGDEALRNSNGERFHKQQSPISLLLRIILSSTNLGDTVFDPFAGTGTTLVVSQQIGRKSIGIEIDPVNIKCIKKRLENIRESDNIKKYYKDYIYTENIKNIWGVDVSNFDQKRKAKSLNLFKD